MFPFNHCTYQRRFQLKHYQIELVENMLHARACLGSVGETHLAFRGRTGYAERNHCQNVCRERPITQVLQTKVSSVCKKRDVEEERDGLMLTQVIGPERYSDWTTPVVPVLRADGKVQLCGDYTLTVKRASHLEKR